MNTRLFARSALAASLALGLSGQTIAAGSKAETLYTLMPQGFKVGWARKEGPSNTVEYIPSRETIQNWSSMVTVKIYIGVANLSPKSFSAKVGSYWTASCPAGVAREVVSGKENGYPFSLWLYACQLNPQTGKPEFMLAKTFAGHDAFYTVQYAFRRQLSKPLVAQATVFLRTVEVCDSRTKDHPCPKDH